MSYLEFLLVLILPPIAVLVLAQPRIWNPAERYLAGWIGVVSVIALVYTTPWDNYLVWRGVWSYGVDRVLGTIGFVPIEEYAFFLLQPCLTGLWTVWCLAHASAAPVRTERSGVRVIGAVWGVAIGLLGFALLRSDAWVYAGLILSWAGIAAGAQWAVAGEKLWRWRKLVVLAVAVPTAYLWLADGIAIRNGIWTISADFTTGLEALGLPVEEALFFLMTNVLVVQGLVLFLPGRAFPSRAHTTQPPIRDAMINGIRQ